MVSGSLIAELVERVERLLNRRKNKLLLTAQSAMPGDQYESYRKQLLNELGNNGFRKDLQDELRQRFKDGQG